jgi:hypothetical protein
MPDFNRDENLKLYRTALADSTDGMFKRIGFVRPLTDHEKAQRALHENLERLRAERLLRQAAERGTNSDRV